MLTALTLLALANALGILAALALLGREWLARRARRREAILATQRGIDAEMPEDAF